MESISCTEIAALENMEKSIEFFRKNRILPSKHFKDCGEVELSDYLGFCRDLLCSVYISNFYN